MARAVDWTAQGVCRICSIIASLDRAVRKWSEFEVNDAVWWINPGVAEIRERVKGVGNQAYHL